jgi:6-phosphofructokinase 1
MEKNNYPSVAYELADQILKKSGNEVRITVPGHTQRGGAPCPYDRALSTRLGVAAAQAFLDGDFGKMIGIRNNKTVRVKLNESAGKLKVVEKDDQFIKEAKLLGISFGD